MLAVPSVLYVPYPLAFSHVEPRLGHRFFLRNSPSWPFIRRERLSKVNCATALQRSAKLDGTVRELKRWPQWR